ncbi:MAG: hypothetical protein IRY99_19480 [Isosphaeraceae bacterium]|nr:hypothetical protein [Isosphaeraceae bacterium]
MSFYQQVRGLLIAILAAAVVGCGSAGDGLPRQHVSGTVTFEGKPLESGSIQFLPATPDQATAAGGVIIDGKYDIPSDQGPTPGTYKVMIFTTSSGVPAPTDAPPGEVVVAPKSAMVIPVRYNHQTELTVKVEAGGPNTFDFKLTK